MKPTPNFTLNAEGQPCYRGKPLENLNALIAHANAADDLAAALDRITRPASLRLRIDPDEDRRVIMDAIKMYAAARTFLPPTE